MDENQRIELTKKIAYKMWQLRTREKDEQGEDNPLFGYGSKETDYLYAKRIVSIFEDDCKYNVQDYLYLFGDILENYFKKDYLSNYVY